MKEEPIIRIGHGYDLHRLESGRKLILAGIEIPFEKGLMGHSDADVIMHAVTDAILGAAGLDDIGQLFPDSDITYKDADSALLLSEALDRVGQQKLRVANIDVTVIVQRPKLAPFKQQMRQNLAGVLGLPVVAVNIKAKTNERVGPEGEGRAISCHAIAGLSRISD